MLFCRVNGVITCSINPISRSAADREIGLIEQVITPFTRQKSTEAKARAEEVQKEIASLSVRLHAALVRGGLNRPR